MNKKMMPVWRIEPGDGTGDSLADVRVRNASGLCAVRSCGKPLVVGCEWWFGCLCLECHEQWRQCLNDLP